MYIQGKSCGCSKFVDSGCRKDLQPDGLLCAVDTTIVVWDHVGIFASGEPDAILPVQVLYASLTNGGVCGESTVFAKLFGCLWVCRVSNQACFCEGRVFPFRLLPVPNRGVLT